MSWYLKLFNTPLVKFNATEDSSTPVITIEWTNDSLIHLLPKGMSLTPEGLAAWLRRRTIPRNRAYVHALLAKCGLSANRPMAILSVCKGLSLNDCYWVVEDTFNGTFEQYNLYDNRLNQILAQLAFTGYGSSIRSSLLSSPEFTTNGMLPKCWRRVDGMIALYKGGTMGAANAGLEPYSEYYAFQVAEAMGLHAVPYRLTKWKGHLCSACSLFTSKEHSFVPVSALCKHFDDVMNTYRSLGGQYWDALIDMLVFDAVVCNTDRHLGNFGFLVDSQTNAIVAPAPLFDHGNALFHQAWADDLDSPQNFQAYVDTLMPCLYGDFFSMAKAHMETRHRGQLRHLLGFRFKRHPRYNLPAQRLKLIEQQIHTRAQQLLLP